MPSGIGKWTATACLAFAVACGGNNNKPGNPPADDPVVKARTVVKDSAQYLTTGQDLTVGSPTRGSLMPGHPPLEQDNVTAIAAEGLLAAWRTTGEQRFLDGATAAADFVSQRQRDFATGEPRFLARMSKLTGNQSYADIARTRFFDALQQGTYPHGTATVNTQGYVQALTAHRSGIAVNLTAWELASIVDAAYMLDRPEAHDWLVALERAVDDTHPGALPPAANPVYWEILSLTESLRAILAAGDPDHYVCAGTNYPALQNQNVQQITALIAGQMIRGGSQDGSLPYQLNLFPMIDDVQTTAYGLGLFARAGMSADILASGVGYLERLQEDSGAIAAAVGADSSGLGAVAPEVAAEAALGILAATPGAVMTGSDDCKKAIAMDVAAVCQ